MNTKVVELENNNIATLGEVIDFEKEKNRFEKTLTTVENKNYISILLQKILKRFIDICAGIVRNNCTYSSNNRDICSK